MNGTEAEQGSSFHRHDRVEELNAYEVIGVEILGGVIEAGFHDVEQDFTPVVDLVKVLGLNHEAAQLNPEVVVGSALLPCNEEEVLEVRDREPTSLQDTLRLSLDVVEVHISEGVIL